MDGWMAGGRGEMHHLGIVHGAGGHGVRVPEFMQSMDG
jgi:hypothetical protein